MPRIKAPLPGPKLPALSAAEKQRAYRERQRDLGITDDRTRKRPQVNTRPTVWDTGEFVAIDGEGFSEGGDFKITMPSGIIYRGRNHYYAYLAASDGTAIISDADRLSTMDVLDFFCTIKQSNPKAIVVCFGGGYDICHTVCHGLNRDELAALLGKDEKKRRKLDINLGGYQYRLEYRPRKSLTIRRWESGVRKYEYDQRAEKWKPTQHLQVVVWDVWGFFQGSFVDAMKKWLPNDPDYEMIKRMKGERNIFERSEIEQIKVYNQAELRCLVKIMEALRAAINDLGLKITRWDGAGAIAAAFLQKHKVTQYKAKPPPDVFHAARCAYSGGHIEVCQLGYYQGKVHHYDVNSAYPSFFYGLPALSTGRWRHGKGIPPSEGFTVIRVSYQFNFGLPFYPLFFRSGDGSIIYPARGTGWYWEPEYSVARKFADKFGAVIFEPLEWWTFESDVDIRPFGWVKDAYIQRQEYISVAALEGRESGPEKVIKNGINSLYGKTAQQVGARIDKEGNIKEPSYFQLEWAGYVTSGTRAQLMEAAIQKPWAIIGFATDGLFSTEPLDLYCPKAKELGAWDYQIHTGITMVMPGVYWLHDGEKIKNYSRGFDKQQMSEVDFIHQAWARKQTTIPIDTTRLVGLGSALASQSFWKMRGCFVTSRRTLSLDGDNSKRYPVQLYKCKPHKELVRTIPRDHFLGDNLPLNELNSEPYPIAWLDGTLAPADDDERIEELEIMDVELA